MNASTYPEKKLPPTPCVCRSCQRTLVERYCLEPECQRAFYAGHAPGCRCADASHNGHKFVSM